MRGVESARTKLAFMDSLFLRKGKTEASPKLCIDFIRIAD